MGNASFRVVFPFLPTISRGLGVSLGTMGAALAIRSASAFAAPVIGRLVDRSSYRRVMFWSLVVGGVAALLAGAAGGIVMFTVALTLGSVAKAAYDTASASWVGATAPFRQRGRIMAVVELAWAGSFLLLMPVFAIVIRATTWRVPFLMLSALLVGAAFLVETRVPQRTFKPAEVSSRFPAPSRIMWPTLVAAVALGAGHEFILVTFATWLENQHGLSISGLGGLAVLLGGAELLATLASIRFIDRVGKMEGVRLGTMALVPICAAITLGNTSLTVAMAMLAILFATFEYTFISFVSLLSQLDPEARGGAISYGFGAVAIGEIAGAPLAPILFEGVNMFAVTLTAAGLFAITAAVMHFLVDEPS